MHTSTGYQVQHPIPLLVSPSHFIFWLCPLASAVAHNLPLHQLLQYYPVISLLLPEVLYIHLLCIIFVLQKTFVLFSSHSLLRESISHHAPSVLTSFNLKKTSLSILIAFKKIPRKKYTLSKKRKRSRSDNTTVLLDQLVNFVISSSNLHSIFKDFAKC